MSEMLKFWGLVLVVVLIIVAVSLLLMKYFKDRPIVRYIPTIVIFLVSVIYFISSIYSNEPMQSLGQFVLSLITGSAALLSLIATFIITKVRKNKGEKK